MQSPVPILHALFAAVAASTLVLVGATPVFAASSTVRVSTPAALKSALAEAQAGDTIVIADGNYNGKFVAAASGTSSSRITLTGSSKVTLTTGSTGSGYGLHVTGDNWTISGFTVAKAAKGIVLDDADNTVLERLTVGTTGQEAIHVRTSSAGAVIRDNVVHDTGLTTPEYGEGIYVGSSKTNWVSIMGSFSSPDRSDNARIENNTIRNTTAEGIDIKEGTTGGLVTGNSFSNVGYSGENFADSWVDLKGNRYTVSGNSGSGTLLDAFQVHTVLAGWGNHNSFSGNTVSGGVPGLEVSVQRGALGTKVACGPSGAAKGLTNVPCSDSAAAPSPAPAVPATESIAADGVTFTSGSHGSVLATVNAPAGVTVKIKVDGKYIGQDSSAPYTFTLKASKGSHEVDVRWTAGGATTRVETVFTR